MLISDKSYIFVLMIYERVIPTTDECVFLSMHKKDFKWDFKFWYIFFFRFSKLRCYLMTNADQITSLSMSFNAKCKKNCQNDDRLFLFYSTIFFF